ncbi:hypothetical protein PYCC9005_000798 [Savitreella phatthalungensis]
MHPPLAHHKHQDCLELINALEECHKAGFLARFGGQCNGIKKDLTLCLRAERLERQRVNQGKAAERKRKADAAWAELERES